MLLGNIDLSVDAVILDLDGTLIDSAPIYFELVDAFLERMGLPPVTRDMVLEAMKEGDFNWDCVFPVHLHHRKSELVEEAVKIVQDIAPDLFRRRVKLVPGADAILNAIAGEDLRIAIVTSTSKKNMAWKMSPLEEAGILDLLETIITTDDTRNKKPHPEPLIKCSRILHVPPSKCVYIGDTRVDMMAGKAAGMKTIGVLTGFDDFDVLSQENPEAIIESVSQLCLLKRDLS